MTPRGIRNNNPGNLVASDEPWQGQVGTDGRFCVFDRPESGFRAMARVLHTYQNKYNLKTVGEIINRYAPPHENRTDLYAESVAAALGVKVEDAVDVSKYDTISTMIDRMSVIENGQQPFDKTVLDEGLRLAGVEVPSAPLKPLTKSRTMWGAGLALTMTIVSWVLENPELVSTMVGVVSPSLALAVPKTLTILGTVYALYARLDDRKQEIR